MDFTKEEVLDMMKNAIYDETRDIFVIEPKKKVEEKKTLSNQAIIQKEGISTEEYGVIPKGSRFYPEEKVKEAIKEFINKQKLYPGKTDTILANKIEYEDYNERLDKDAKEIFGERLVE